MHSRQGEHSFLTSAPWLPLSLHPGTHAATQTSVGQDPQGPPYSPAIRLQDPESHKRGLTFPAWHSVKDSFTKGSQEHKIIRDLRDLPAAQQ